MYVDSKTHPARFSESEMIATYCVLPDDMVRKVRQRLPGDSPREVNQLGSKSASGSYLCRKCKKIERRLNKRFPKNDEVQQNLRTSAPSFAAENHTGADRKRILAVTKFRNPRLLKQSLRMSTARPQAT